MANGTALVASFSVFRGDNYLRAGGVLSLCAYDDRYMTGMCIIRNKSFKKKYHRNQGCIKAAVSVKYLISQLLGQNSNIATVAPLEIPI